MESPLQKQQEQSRQAGCSDRVRPEGGGGWGGWGGRSTCDDKPPTIFVQPSANYASHKLVLLVLRPQLLLLAYTFMPYLLQAQPALLPFLALNSAI